MQSFLVNLLNGVSFGSVLFLLAAGLSVMIGVMGILNLAHGALYMLGAYVGWTIAVQYKLNFLLAVVAGGVAAGIVGLVMERGFLRRLYKRYDEQVLLTFGFVYILVNVSMWIWGAQAKPSFSPSFLSGSLHFGDSLYPVSRLATIALGLLVAIGLWWLQQRTRVGAIIRAGMDDEEMTRGLGINLRLVSSVVFFLAAFVAGMAGVVGSQLLGVSPDMGVDILLLSLIVVIVGGVGSVQGALAGAMLIGIVDA